MLFSLTSSHISPSKSPSSSFNFLQLHNKLTSLKQKQNSNKQLSKQTLQIYEKKQPNKQLIKYCDKMIQKYQNHYNINRNYEICKLKNIQKNNQVYYQNRISINNQEEQQENKIKYYYNDENNHLNQEKTLNLLKRSRSTMASFTNNIMKPIKINDTYKKLQPIKKQFKQNSLLSSKNILNKLLSTQKQFRIKQKSNQQNKNKKAITSKSPNSLIKFRQLQYKFRKTIWLIIQKLRESKLSYSQIILYNIFSLQPYKFGRQIFQAVKSNNQPLTFRLIIQNKFCVFSIDTTYKTPLIWACIRGCEKIVQLLISRGVDCQKKDINHMRAIQYAVKYGHDKCVKVLLLMGKNVKMDDIVNGKVKQISKQVKKILRVYKNNYKELRKLNYLKKKIYFDEQYKHDLYD